MIYYGTTDIKLRGREHGDSIRKCLHQGDQHQPDYAEQELLLHAVLLREQGRHQRRQDVDRQLHQQLRNTGHERRRQGADLRVRQDAARVRQRDGPNLIKGGDCYDMGIT